ncbi:MAG: nuclease-related domain-containing protein [Anaerolineales bacterium]|jgi:hypothetical protein
MKLIDKDITDIILGYDTILRAETEMRNQWRSRLLVAYTQRLSHAKLAFRKRKFRLLTIIFFGIGFTIIGIGFSFRSIWQSNEYDLLHCFGGLFFILFGVLSLASIWFSQQTTRRSNKKRVPLHPFRFGPNKQKIYPNLRAKWMDGLSGDIEKQIPDYPDDNRNIELDYGAEGERIFIQRLNGILDDHIFAIARFLKNPRDDIDLILIGSKGIWVFEVKHWSGEIFWDDQGWRRVQTYYELGGMEVVKQTDIRKTPDQQWVRSAEQVRHLLHSHAPEILSRFPELEQVKGGIVFTKQNSKLNFQPGRPVFWGTLDFWIKTIHQNQTKIYLDNRNALKLVEIILEHHQKLDPGKTRSMRNFAQVVVRNANQQLTAWVE